MIRGRTALIVGAAVVTVAGTIAVALASDDPAPAARAPEAPATSTVERKDLRQTKDLTGQLGYAGARTLTGRTPGIVTWLPGEGAVLRRGDVVYRADNQPVVLFYGDTPLYRVIGTPAPPPTDDNEGDEGDDAGDEDDDTSAPAPPVAQPLVGPDVEVLEQNLYRLGFLRTTPDDRMTVYTVAAIKAWQQSLGEQVTGRVDPTHVIVLPGRSRVDHVTALLGDTATENVADLTSVDKEVTVPVDAADTTGLRPDVAVTVTLPDGTQTKGKIDTVGRRATAPDDSNDSSDSGGAQSDAQIVMTVQLDNRSSARDLDAGPVTVTVPGTVHEGVLVVPVGSLLALHEGGYALQVVRGHRKRGPDKTVLVPVETGLFVDDSVEVTGAGLEAGQTIVSAS